MFKSRGQGEMHKKCIILDATLNANQLRAGKKIYELKLVESIASLTKVDVMPAHAPAASLPITDNSPSCPLNNFYKCKNVKHLVPHTNYTESEGFQNMGYGITL